MLTGRTANFARLPVMFVVLLALAALTAPGAFGAGAGSTQLVSRPDGLGPVAPALDNNSSTPGALSTDGRYAVFVSDADGLATGLNLGCRTCSCATGRLRRRRSSAAPTVSMVWASTRVIVRIVDVRRLLSGESNRQHPSQ